MCMFVYKTYIYLHAMKVCRNINQIKICMETGRTVVLLNLENLYESLYDLLNQVSSCAICYIEALHKMQRQSLTQVTGVHYL